MYRPRDETDYCDPGSYPLYSIVAWRLLWMTGQVHIDSGQSPTVAFSPDEIAVSERLASTQKPARPVGQPLTLHDAARVTAKLRGFLGRKCGGEPGGETLAAGISPVAAALLVGRSSTTPDVISSIGPKTHLLSHDDVTPIT